jgi:hypothetical protein
MLIIASPMLMATEDNAIVSDGFEANKQCFDCHGQRFYSFENQNTGLIERKAMNPNYVYSQDAYYRGVHKNFACTDCHSPEYETWPHQAELRLEPMYTCLDCHGGDPTYEHLHFELLEEEFLKSVHAERIGDAFTCWKCHDPHSYKRMTTGEFRISEIVSYHNSTCMNCHSNNDHYQLFSDDIKPGLEKIHHFLPNFKLHFSAVRCIECHTSSADTLWVNHNILPKENAVKNCVECHSTSTILMASLYKYQNIEGRKERGFLNAVILNEAYVIGANRNEYLNLISIILFGLTLAGIIIHTIFRLMK